MVFAPILLRPSRSDDLDALTALATASCLSSIDQLPVFRDRKDEIEPAFRRFLSEEWPRILVAEHDQQILGLVSPDVKTGEISDLWVDPAEQGTGIGGVLLSAGEAAIRQNGQSCAWLTTHADNRKALRFYLSQGYALLSIAPVVGTTLPDVTYPRALLGKQLSRPDAAKAKTMMDVRAGIDMLDPMLVSLLAERFAFIDRAADLKPTLAMPARVQERVEEVVANARSQAESLGFSPDLIEKLWRAMVDLAIAREEDAMMSKNRTSTSKTSDTASLTPLSADLDTKKAAS